MPRRHGFIGAARHDLVVAQHAGELAVRERMQHDEVDAGLHFVADALLQRVHRRDQRREIVGRRRGIGARDVRRVAVELGAGVDQAASA